MNKKEKIQYIYELAAGGRKKYYSLFSSDELYTMLGMLKKYKVSQLSDATMDTEDNKIMLDMYRKYDQRLKQLTPDELDAVMRYGNNSMDWDRKTKKQVEDIQERLGIKHNPAAK